MSITTARPAAAVTVPNSSLKAPALELSRRWSTSTNTVPPSERASMAMSRTSAGDKCTKWEGPTGGQMGEPARDAVDVDRFWRPGGAMRKALGREFPAICAEASAGELGPYLRQAGHGLLGQRAPGGELDGLLQVLHAGIPHQHAAHAGVGQGEPQRRLNQAVRVSLPPPGTGSPPPAIGPGRNRDPNRWARRWARRRDAALVPR